MNPDQRARLEIVTQLEAARPDRHSFDTLQLARFVETGDLGYSADGDDDEEDAAAAALADAVHRGEIPNLVELIKRGAVLGPFTVPNKPADPGEGVWCEGCRKYHPLPDEDEMKAAVRDFLRSVVQPDKPKED